MMSLRWVLVLLGVVGLSNAFAYGKLWEVSGGLRDVQTTLTRPFGSDVGSLEKCVGDLRSNVALLMAVNDRPLENSDRNLQAVIRGHDETTARHLRIAAAYEDWVLGSIAATTRDLLRQISISFISPQERDQLDTNRQVLEDLLRLHRSSDTTPRDKSREIGFVSRRTELAFVQQLLNGLVTFSKVHRLGEPGPDDTSAQRRERAALLDDATRIWDKVAAEWRDLDGQANSVDRKHMRFFSDVDRNKLRSNWKLDRLIANAQGVVLLHRFIQIAADRRRKESGKRESWVEANHRKQEQILDLADQKFAEAISQKADLNSDRRLNIAFSNKSVVLGRRLQLLKERLPALTKTQDTDKARELLARAEEFYKEGVSLLESVLDEDAGNLDQHTRCVVLNNLATWHYEIGAMRLGRLQVAAGTVDGLGWSIGIKENDKDWKGLMEAVTLAREALDDAIAGRVVVGVVYFTEIEVLWLEAKVALAFKLEWTQKPEKRADKMNRFFFSVRSSVARRASEVLKWTRKGVLEGESYPDLRSLIPLMNVDVEGGSDTQRREARQKEFLSRLGRCLGKQAW